jgi:hypothetical protein
MFEDIHGIAFDVRNVYVVDVMLGGVHIFNDKHSRCVVRQNVVESRTRSSSIRRTGSS